MKGCLPNPWDPTDGLGYEPAASIAFLLLGVLGLASVTSLVVRFRCSQGVERQQLKWFTDGAGVLALLLAISAASQALNDPHPFTKPFTALPSTTSALLSREAGRGAVVRCEAARGIAADNLLTSVVSPSRRRTSLPRLG